MFLYTSLYAITWGTELLVFLLFSVKEKYIKQDNHSTFALSPSESRII